MQHNKSPNYFVSADCVVKYRRCDLTWPFTCSGRYNEDIAAALFPKGHQCLIVQMIRLKLEAKSRNDSPVHVGCHKATINSSWFSHFIFHQSPLARPVIWCFIFKELCTKIGRESLFKVGVSVQNKYKMGKGVGGVSLTSLTCLKRTWQQERAEKEKGGWGDVSWRWGEQGWGGGILWSKALLVALLCPYTSIIYICTHSSLLLTRRCHSVLKKCFAFSEKNDPKSFFFCFFSVSAVRDER